MMVTVPEAARQVGLHPETIRRWIRAGRLRSEKVGTQHLIDTDQLDALVDDRPVDLPPRWDKADFGAMPPWEQLVRDSRAAH